MVIFSKSIIEEYKAEMAITYGVFVSDTDAQTQLTRLVHTIFPSATRNERDASDAPARTHLLDHEVGASITPTSGQND